MPAFRRAASTFDESIFYLEATGMEDCRRVNGGASRRARRLANAGAGAALVLVLVLAPFAWWQYVQYIPRPAPDSGPVPEPNGYEVEERALARLPPLPSFADGPRRKKEAAALQALVAR